MGAPVPPAPQPCTLTGPHCWPALQATPFALSFQGKAAAQRQFERRRRWGGREAPLLLWGGACCGGGRQDAAAGSAQNEWQAGASGAIYCLLGAAGSARQAGVNTCAGARHRSEATHCGCRLAAAGGHAREAKKMQVGAGSQA